MRNLLPISLIPALLLTIPTATIADPHPPDFGIVEVLVTDDGTPIPGAMVALDLNNNGHWDDHLAEPRDATDANGIVVFGDVVSVQDPAGDAGPQGTIGDWHPSRILTGNLRGTVGAREVKIDFVLPAGSGSTSLGLFDLRGRRLAQTHGADELVLDLPGGLPSGVYFLRLGARPSAPVSQRITSAGLRTQTIRAARVSAAEAVAAGWLEPRPAAGKQRQRTNDPHHINLIVTHPDYPLVVQPEIIVSGLNQFTVDFQSQAPAGFVYLLPGTFMMGSPDDEPGRFSWEGPQHQVTLTKGFYMAKYAVTEQWWAEVMNERPTTSQLPKVDLSWDLAVEFCNALSVLEGLTPAYTIHGPTGNTTWNQSANGYRLPTEAEWEYACRATTTLAYNNDTNCLSSDTEANFYGVVEQLPGCPTGIYREVRIEVGSFPPNQWGLYDMHGNAFEWVWCCRRTYTNIPQVDPVVNTSLFGERVFRGGAWLTSARACRSAYRTWTYPQWQAYHISMRPVRSAY